MELGNAMWGNSRGEYPLDRGEGFEEELYRLFDQLYNTKQNGYYGTAFENDTFAVMPYYWGDCTCGYDDRENEWCKKNDHQPECYYVAFGCASRCNCDYSDRWNEFVKTHGHSKDCPIVKPNFLYKPTGFEIQWYKYPFRDSYTNQPITLDEFKAIIDNCIASVVGL